MMIEPEWFQYAIFDDEGHLIGISSDAPESAKEEYEAYLSQINSGIKP